MKERIIVTPRSLSREGHPCLQRLEDTGFELLFPAPGEQPSERQLLEVIGNCVAYLAGVETITARILKNADRLRVISRNGVGVDNIDLKTARELGIAIEKTHGANAQGVAELESVDRAANAAVDNILKHIL
jgi:D-3-phosphoglycerate dehydrogenase